MLPSLIIQDIDGDERNEVLINLVNESELGEGKLLCINHKGNLKWQFNSGRETRFGSNVFSSDYKISGIGLVNLNKDNNLEIIIFSEHRYRFPTQLVVLNYNGEKIGEYWHSGRLTDYALVDLNGDKREEIIFVGMNNEYKKACLIVFDKSKIEGGSPQSGEFKGEGLKEGTEKYYLLFPRTDVGLLQQEVGALDRIEILKNRRLSLFTVGTRIFFELNFSLEVQNVVLSHKFKQMHKNATRNGIISSEINNKYLDKLKRGLLYYNGNKWVSEPTMTSYWKKESLNQ